MKYSMPILALIALAAVLPMPPAAQGQSTNERLLSVQRDVVAVERAVKEARAELNEKIAALEGQNQQLLKAIVDLGAKLDKMQADSARALAEQQQRVAEPVGVLRSNVDQVGLAVGALQSSQAAIGQKLTKVETDVADLKELVKAIGAQQVQDAPPPPIEGTPFDEQRKLFDSGMRDFTGGNDELAMTSFRELVDKYPTSPDAPQAYLFIGQLFDRAKQFTEAVTAYDYVLMLYPMSAQASEALYSKGESLRLAGKKAEARAAFQEFLQKYPNDPKKDTAAVKLREVR